jgi:hypothetical protein
MRGRGPLLALILGLVTLANAAADDRVLFIGNSLTASNDLPLLVEAMAREKGLSLSTEAVTYPNLSLEDHWERDTQSVIRPGGFKYVVLQQGPSSLPASRENLREWARRFGEEIRRAGAIPALYMVWPDRSRLAFFPEVKESYRLAAEDVKGLLLPAGEAWVAAWRRDSKLNLYGADNFHPSRLGTYAAAATILSGLTGISPKGLPARFKLRNGYDYGVDDREARAVLEAVAEVTLRAKP